MSTARPRVLEMHACDDGKEPRSPIQNLTWSILVLGGLVPGVNCEREGP